MGVRKLSKSKDQKKKDIKKKKKNCYVDKTYSLSWFSSNIVLFNLNKIHNRRRVYDLLCKK